MGDSLHPAPGPEPSASQAGSRLRLVVETGLRLSRERDLDVIVQSALDAGLELSGAAFGAFFYNNVGADGSPYQLYKLSGAGVERFARFPPPRPTQVFAESFVNAHVLRSGDILQDPRYGHNEPFHGMPPGHPPVRSYLSVPVLGRSRETLGALIYGHPNPDVFSADVESLVATIAAQAANAIENTRLAESLLLEIAHADAARHAQREMAERLEQVFEVMTDGVALMDRQWRFTYLNRTGAQILGNRSDVVGRHYLEVFPDATGSNFQRQYAEAMSGHTVEFTDYYPALDLWTALRVFPTPEGIAIFFHDVTRERQAERDLMESQRRLRQALDAGQLGTWTWDAATDDLDLDERAAELLHSEVHRPVKRRALRGHLVHHDDVDLTPDDLREVLADGDIYRSEYRVQGPDGEYTWIAARGIATYKEGTAEIVGMIGTVQDITVRKTQEATLRQSEKLAATGRLAATIAHEINNPLEAVTNLIYLCKTDPLVPSSIQSILETADGELARISQIAQQTLGFYRDTTEPREIDLTALLQAVVDLFGHKLGSKKLTCKLQIEPGLRVFGLQGELRQVFSNLLVNSIDAAESSEICIRAHCRNLHGRPTVFVLVADRGSGILHSVRERLFSPFFTTKDSFGTGLGLWVSRGIVEKHGGSIAFRTRTEEPPGTVFRIAFPAQTGVTSG